PHRRAHRLCAADECALFKRSDLRPAHTGPEHGGALVTRRRLPWLRAGRRDFLRDAQRLPRSSARRACAWRSRRCILPGYRMIDAVLDLPGHLRKRLVSALESGALALPYSAASLRSVLGICEGGEDVVGVLLELERLGVSGQTTAIWLKSIEVATSRI